MAVSLETWVSIGSLVVVAVGLYGALSVQNTRLRKEFGELRTELKGDIGELRTESKGDIGELRTELKGDIGELRTELKADIGRLDDRVAGLDDRVYALAVGLRPRLRSDEPVEHGGSPA